MQTCHDCGANPGELHMRGCDVERCPTCGQQLISCGHHPSEGRRLPWSGEWPGKAECREFGWYVWEEQDDSQPYPCHIAWHRCGPDHPRASEDLNRLYEGEAIWNRTLRRFTLR
jgi:hypothetical protein